MRATRFTVRRVAVRLALRRFAAAKQGGAAVEFGVCGPALFGFILGIVNLGLLGFQFGALVHAVQETGRWAAVQATASVVNSETSITEPCLGSDVSEFNALADPPLGAMAQPTGTAAASGTQTTGNVTLTVSWNGTAGSANGIYDTLTGILTWRPLGFASFGPGFSMKISTAASAAGSSVSGVTVNASCS
jgi:Flp pilus assembly protein TadG